MALKKNIKSVAKKSSKEKTSSKKRRIIYESPKIKGYYYIIFFLILLLVDRVTKSWAMTLTDSIDKGFFQFNFVVNTGAGFSIFQNFNSMLIWISIIILGLLIFFNNYLPKISFTLILAGLMGNLIDRVFYGGVIDFIDLRFWPIFNFADTIIVIGVTYSIIILLAKK